MEGQRIQIETSLGKATGTITNEVISFMGSRTHRIEFSGNVVDFDDGPAYPGLLFDFWKAVYLDSGWVKIVLSDDHYGQPEYKCKIIKK
jgi:hypothetical protein